MGKRLSLLFAASLVALVTIFAAPFANACVIAPEQATARQLVDRTPVIIRGDVQSVRVVGRYRYYRIKVIERLKGEAPDTITHRLSVYQWSADQGHEDYALQPPPGDLHDARFWIRETAAGAITPSCEIFFLPWRGPHVIFLKAQQQPDDVRGFEPITGTDDSWYKTVKRMIADRKLQGHVVSPREFVRSHHAVYRFSCVSFGPYKVNTRCGEPRRIWGKPVNTKMMIWGGKIAPNACREGDLPPCRAFWVFLVQRPVEVSMSLLGHPFAVRVERGQLMFEKRYGDLVLTQTRISEREMLQALR